MNYMGMVLKNWYKWNPKSRTVNCPFLDFGDLKQIWKKGYTWAEATAAHRSLPRDVTGMPWGTCREAWGSRWFKKRSKKKDRKNMKRYEEWSVLGLRVTCMTQTLVQCGSPHQFIRFTHSLRPRPLSLVSLVLTRATPSLSLGDHPSPASFQKFQVLNARNSPMDPSQQWDLSCWFIIFILVGMVYSQTANRIPSERRFESCQRGICCWEVVAASHLCQEQ